MRFNPPPNWPPAPPGWTPPPDWRPDPNWPPPPPGWQLWIPDAPAGGKRTALIVGGVAVAIVTVVGIVLTVVLMSRSDDGGAVPSSTTRTSVQASSDEEQIDEKVAAFEKAWNNEDFDAMSEIVCDELHQDPEFTESDFLESRRDSGRLSLTVQNYDITGNTAVVSIEQLGATTNDFDFVREDGEWKWCEL
jgi:hypothetical protein